MKRTLSILGVVALLAGLIATQAMAFGPGGGRGNGNGPAYYQALAPEKQAAVAKIMDEHQAKMFSLREDLWAKQTELDALKGNDTKRIQALVNEMKDIHTKMYTEREALRQKLEAEGVVMGGPGMMGGQGRGGRGGCGGAGGYGPCGGQGPANCPAFNQ